MRLHEEMLAILGDQETIVKSRVPTLVLGLKFQRSNTNEEPETSSDEIEVVSAIYESTCFHSIAEMPSVFLSESNPAKYNCILYLINPNSARYFHRQY